MFVSVIFVTEHEQQDHEWLGEGWRSVGLRAKALDLVTAIAVVNHEPAALKVALEGGLLLGVGDPIPLAQERNSL